MRIGLFGGAFDPVHIGHLNIANQSAEKFGLGRVYFIPTAVPPHKKKGGADPADRLKMVRLAVSSNPVFTVSLREMAEDGPSFTIDTVSWFQKRHGASLYYILGSDAFEDLHKWKSSGEMLFMCNFIVVSRPGSDMDSVQKKVSGRLRACGVALTPKKKSADAIADRVLSVPGSPFSVHICKFPEFGVSSTEIRHRAGLGKSLRYLVPDSVGQYIRKNGLYSKVGKGRNG
ncbi:MAG: nicotinate (nicotinamide) nucleotide adenylyltransferase [Nitrospinae bacterium]|nr:nicotinate (nicotinamide) nucleotide adenylyltransferase [Nitrospinota bacterium]